MKRVHSHATRAKWPSSRPEWQRENYRKMIGRVPGEVMDLLEAMAIRTRKEVASALGITPQAVHQGERRALRKIRAALAEYRRQARA